MTTLTTLLDKAYEQLKEQRERDAALFCEIVPANPKRKK